MVKILFAIVATIWLILITLIWGVRRVRRVRCGAEGCRFWWPRERSRSPVKDLARLGPPSEEGVIARSRFDV